VADLESLLCRLRAKIAAKRAAESGTAYISEADDEKKRRESGKQSQETMARWKEQQEEAAIAKLKRVCLSQKDRSYVLIVFDLGKGG